jgi:hypothetical protein
VPETWRDWFVDSTGIMSQVPGEVAPTIVTDDKKAIQHAEGDRRNSKEVHRGNRFPVIAEKGKPAVLRKNSIQRFSAKCNIVTIRFLG